MVEKLYNEKCQEIAKLRTKLTKTIESTNSIFEEANTQISISIDKVDTSCNEKNHKITLLKTELLDMIEKANKKYCELKGFQ